MILDKSSTAGLFAHKRKSLIETWKVFAYMRRHPKLIAICIIPRFRSFLHTIVFVGFSALTDAPNLKGDDNPDDYYVLYERS